MVKVFITAILNLIPVLTNKAAANLGGDPLKALGKQKFVVAYSFILCEDASL